MGVGVGAAVAAWLAQREMLQGMEQTPQAFAESLPIDSGPLWEVIRRLYGASWLAGTRDAVAQLGPKADGTPQKALTDATDWGKWTPGDVPDDDALDHVDFESMWSQAGIWQREMDQTTRKQIADALQEGISKGLGAKQTADLVDQVVHNPKRAMLIARTEVNRAMSQAQIASYRAAGEPAWDLITMPGACPICETVRAGNPHPISDAAEIPPEHPACRCCCAPAIRTARPAEPPLSSLPAPELPQEAPGAAQEAPEMLLPEEANRARRSHQGHMARLFPPPPAVPPSPSGEGRRRRRTDPPGQSSGGT